MFIDIDFSREIELKRLFDNIKTFDNSILNYFLFLKVNI